MTLNKSAHKFFNGTNQKKINRRTFFRQSVGYTSVLTLLAFPGIITEALAAKEEKSKEEIFKELEAKVEKFMPMYRSCSQPSFASLNEQFEFKADQTIPALMPFAGGIAGKGETCGAVTGSLLAIGFHFEPINQKEMKKAGSSIKYGGLFFDRFTKEFGSTRCKEVIKHQLELSTKGPNCIEVVKKAVLIAADIILENY